MSQHLIEESRVLYPDSGQRPETASSGGTGVEERGGPGAMRQTEMREATVSTLDRDRASLREAAPGPSAGSAEDLSLAALDALGRALHQIAEDQQLLETKLEELRRKRESGMEWREILANEDGPGSMQIVSRMLACLAKASGTLRKELVDTLRREGVSIPAIARMFGVTHQRVSNLLRRPAE